MTKFLLHIEGLFVLLISVYFYGQIDGSWWIFFLCLLIPDISMLGYMINNAIGSTIYNIVHSYVIPLTLIIFSVNLQQDLMLTLSLIWIAHIGMDRTVGYGLKYPSNPKNTHLQKA
ncbi:DUF4260 domain-containing protein [Bacillus solimangrovi]|uniref:DUF4260 domain-containing protein n=1 Tax=Bacillus solimangrovi TaxID=1305675 RepID=A0A1E5LJ37_9BACI|nr:DUF4260 domain-containing protein [Bacillus solimangrovi]OEH94094.1 hypothetical protein BFG57_09615 [Bacillus solimangrovi]